MGKKEYCNMSCSTHDVFIESSPMNSVGAAILFTAMYVMYRQFKASLWWEPVVNSYSVEEISFFVYSDGSN